MRNFKKILSLVLAMAMSLSLAVSAGAAFNDQDKIVNQEAVDVCTTLNIINGYTDGSFKPEGDVSRAEMAKMICIVLNGGKEPTTATKADPTFADIDGHWAEGFIEYCYAEGVVAGKGANSFDPNGKVTGTEAAKMLLIALGYNQDVEKFVGANWALYVNVKANQDGLYEDLESMDPSAALSRDNAAQMIYNALNAKTIRVESSIDRNDGSIVDTYTKTGTDLLAAKFGAYNEVGVLAAVKYNEKKGAYIVNVTGVDTSFEAAEDYSALIGQTVNVMFDGKATYDADGNLTSANVDTLYGIYADDDNQVVTGLIADADVDMTNAVVDYEDEEYNITGMSIIAPNGTAITASKYFESDWSPKDYYNISIIDTDNNDVYTTGVVVPAEFGQVKYISSTKITVDNGLLSTVDTDDCALYDGIAKDDYVAVVHKDYTVSGLYEVTKLDMISGKVDATKAGSVRIDGTWYYDFSGAGLDYEGDFYLYNGCIVDKEAKAGSIDDTAYVIAVGSTFDVDGNYQAKVMIGGEPQVVTVDLSRAAGGDITTSTVDTYCTYDLEDGVYTFNAITSSNTPDSTLTYAAVQGYADKKLHATFSAGAVSGTSYIIDEDAVIYVKYKTDEYTVLSGADVAAWGENAKSAAGVVLTKVENGMTVVVGGELDLGAASIPTATATYGVVTSAIVTATDGKAEFTIWNGAEYIDVVTKSSVSSLAKWDVVDYQKNTDGTYQIAEVGDGTRLSITGYSATSGDIKVNWGSGDNDRVVTEDTVVIFVNTDADADAAGLLGESIEVSAQPNGVDYNRNAVCVKDATTNDLLVLVIDPLNTVYGD